MSATVPTQRVCDWLAAFGAALERGDHDAVAAMFDDDSYWRDLVCFTWNIKTMEGKTAIRAMLDATAATTKASGWKVEGEATEAGDVTEAWLSFETAHARGKGHIRLEGDKCWTLLTTMTELKGFEVAKGPTRPKGVEHGASQDRTSWLERKTQEERDLGQKEQPYCVIIGGGQGGIALGARLRLLGVPTIIVEKNPRAGDSWRNRYRSLCLHDPVWYDHLPYLPFPEHWPVFAPKDKIGDWLEMYTRVMELNYWGSTTAKSAERSGDGWEVVVDRAGEEVTLKPRHVVLALGVSGKPNTPTIPGQEVFRGEQHHSSAHPGPDAYKGKKAVVVGSN
ncbi:MAG: NAD(P)/FAD-dependent oxidoreductase, partial [Gemmatimonadaceae bacterium]|nr:NAD(P)/FAD-dependent oxidoreductase [Gemmatimonadaceae bacterium]